MGDRDYVRWIANLHVDPVVLARSENVAIVLAGITAQPGAWGFELDLVARAQREMEDLVGADGPPMLFLAPPSTDGARRGFDLRVICADGSQFGNWGQDGASRLDFILAVGTPACVYTKWGVPALPAPGPVRLSVVWPQWDLAGDWILDGAAIAAAGRNASAVFPE